MRYVAVTLLVLCATLFAGPATAHAGTGDQMYSGWRMPNEGKPPKTEVMFVYVGGYFPLIIITTK